MNLNSSYSFRHCAIVFLLLFAIGCKKESVQAPSPAYDYFPTEKGLWIIYDVDSIYHGVNDNNNDDSVYTYHFQNMDMIDSSFINASGQPTQVLLRYKRNTPSDEWILNNVWTQQLTRYGAYRVENNIEYHKLAFPIGKEITWNGNDANTLGEEDYYYLEYNVPLTVQGLSFDSTVSVLQRYDDNYIEKIYGNEIYANHVGLVFKERDELGKINGNVVKGLEYRMTLSDYGPR
jgi:hypothetical protein